MAVMWWCERQLDCSRIGLKEELTTGLIFHPVDSSGSVSASTASTCIQVSPNKVTPSIPALSRGRVLSRAHVTN